MKQITNKTILKQGDKTYQPIEFGGMITWCDEHDGILAQSEPKLDGVPVIEIGSTGFDEFEYTQADIERALSLAFLASQDGYDITTKEILEQINSISVIEVDEDFNVINFE
jgi:hypothetical protein